MKNGFHCILTTLLILTGSLRTSGQDVLPNILLVLVDDMGYGDLSCYGSKQIQTPNIDALAQSGVRCTQGYVTSTVCAPSRAGLLTGRYQNRFGFEHNLIETPDHVKGEYMAIPKDEKTMGDYLKQVGYRTACIGKWHVGQTEDWHLPNERGFDYFFGMLNGNHPYFPDPNKNHLWRNKEKIDKIDVPYLTDWITEEAIQFIERKDDQNPWFLYLTYNTPHTPLQAKEEDIARFAHIKDKKRQTYAAMQYCLDQNIGRLTKHLQQKGQLENTLIVFLSDNGGACTSNAAINAPLRGQKSMFLEGGIRTPFLLSWPGRLPADQVYEQPVSSLDLLPTFLSLADAVALAKPLDGVNLIPFLAGTHQGHRPHETLYWRMLLRGAAIRHGDWKLVRLAHRPPELYNLAEDVSELNNQAAVEPEMVKELMNRLFDWESENAANPIWFGGTRWLKGSRANYDKEYVLVQPNK